MKTFRNLQKLIFTVPSANDIALPFGVKMESVNNFVTPPRGNAVNMASVTPVVADITNNNNNNNNNNILASNANAKKEKVLFFLCFIFCTPSVCLCTMEEKECDRK